MIALLGDQIFEVLELGQDVVLLQGLLPALLQAVTSGNPEEGEMAWIYLDDVLEHSLRSELIQRLRVCLIEFVSNR